MGGKTNERMRVVSLSAVAKALLHAGPPAPVTLPRLKCLEKPVVVDDDGRSITRPPLLRERETSP
jgi:hypothetical protein